jgi:hypothetical protein
VTVLLHTYNFAVNKRVSSTEAGTWQARGRASPHYWWLLQGWESMSVLWYQYWYPVQRYSFWDTLAVLEAISPGQ